MAASGEKLMAIDRPVQLGAVDGYAIERYNLARLSNIRRKTGTSAST